MDFDPRTIPPFETEEMKSPIEKLLARPEVIEQLGKMRRDYVTALGVTLAPRGDEVFDRGMLEYLQSLTVAERIQQHYEFREYAKRVYLNALLQSEFGLETINRNI